MENKYGIYDAFDEIFIDFYDKNYTFLVKYIFIHINDFSIAEDLAHDIFLRLYKSKNIGIANPKIKNYIKRAAKNMIADYFKRSARDEAKRKKIIPVLQELDETVYSCLEDSVIGGEVISTVHDVLDEFSEKDKKIFISRIIEQKPRRQVSEEEEISTYIVKRVEDEIIQILRRKLKPFL